jgi:RNA polymerase sigma-70 factor (ECF subfamily)
MPEQSPSSLPSAKLNAAIQLHLGQQLQAIYGDPTAEALPFELRGLIKRLEETIQAQAEPIDQAFVAGIMAAVLPLRTFALSLTRNVDTAEDLVQATMLRAIRHRRNFQDGTNLEAWLFTILRNDYLSGLRKRKREVEDTDGSYVAKLVSIPEQPGRLDFQDFHAALNKLPADMRQAVMLIGAEGMSYEQAAEALNVAVGTVKSRVNRARAKLAELLGLDSSDPGGSRTARA